MTALLQVKELYEEHAKEHGQQAHEGMLMQKYF